MEGGDEIRKPPPSLDSGSSEDEPLINLKSGSKACLSGRKRSYTDQESDSAASRTVNESLAGSARAERKRKREKNRRTALNKQLDALSALLLKVEPSLASQRSKGEPQNRVDLIQSAVEVLERLHNENEELKAVLNDLKPSGVASIARQPAGVALEAAALLRSQPNREHAVDAGVLATIAARDKEKQLRAAAFLAEHRALQMLEYGGVPSLSAASPAPSPRSALSDPMSVLENQLVNNLRSTVSLSSIGNSATRLNDQTVRQLLAQQQQLELEETQRLLQQHQQRQQQQQQQQQQEESKSSLLNASAALSALVERAKEGRPGGRLF